MTGCSLTTLPAALGPTIADALVAYRSDRPVANVADRRLAGRAWDPILLLAFRDALRAMRG